MYFYIITLKAFFLLCICFCSILKDYILTNMKIIKTKTDVIIDPTIDEVVMHANFIRLKTDKIIVADIPFEVINSILIVGSATIITGRLIKVCSEKLIPIHVLTDQNRHYGSLYFATHPNIINRIKQFQVFTNVHWALFLAKNLLYQKIKTQSIIFENITKYLDKIGSKSKTQQLLGLEGSAANRYWDQFSILFKSNIPKEMKYNGRKKFPTIDPINSLLSLGYGLLATQCQTSLTINGLDPFFGILHKVNPSRPALVYDLMEVYRSLIVDVWVVELFNQEIFVKEDFVLTQEGVCTLCPDKKNLFFKLWYKRLKNNHFKTNYGKLTILEFIDLNSVLLIKLITNLHNNKIRDRGNYTTLSKYLIEFQSIEEFRVI
jgi:CRISP-associated protein Cas1